MADKPPAALFNESPTSPKVIANIEERVALMEKTRAEGVNLIGSIDKSLGQAERSAGDVQSWFEIANKLLKSTCKQSLLVGICGETGQGKSTLINALLDMDIAPTSEAEACTAAVCVFSWNLEDDPNKAFQAKIIYKSVDSIKQELSSFLEEARELAAVKLEDCDAEIKARKDAIKKNLKLIVGWSGLTEDTIMSADSAQDIMKKANHPLFKTGSPEIGYRVEIHAASAREFSKLLAPFVDSKNRKKKDWPLVELVQIYVKAQVLQHGIHIVDLPGIMDALEARCTVAKSFMWRLNKRIVVVPAARATDNKTAMDLMLPSTDILDMQLDDQFSPDSLAVAVNAIDNIGIKNAEDEWGEYDAGLSDLCSDLEEKISLMPDLNDQIKELREEIADLQASAGSDDELTEDDAADMPQEHVLKGVSHAEPESLKAFRSKLAELEQQRKAILEECSVLEHRITKCCIAARNARITTIFSENAKQSSKEGPPTGTTNVFPNSAKAYFKLKSGVPAQGFEGIESAGIHALRRWIIEVSLPHREEAARSHIQELNILFDAASGWMQSDALNIHGISLPLKHGSAAFKDLRTLNDNMSKIMVSLLAKSSTCLANLKPLRDSHISKQNKHTSTDNEAVDKAVEYFRQAFETWEKVKGLTGREEKRIHWATYRKCVRGHGLEWTSKARGGITYNWMDTIYESFWRPCANRWRVEMHQKLAVEESKLISSVRDKFGHFVIDLINTADQTPGLGELVRREMYVIKHALEDFINRIHEYFHDYRLIVRNCRLSTKKTFAEDMRPGFEEAMAHTGKGSFKKQREIMRQHVEMIRDTMFKQCRDKLEIQLSRDKNTLIKNIRDNWRSKGHLHIHGHLRRIVRSICPRLRESKTEPDNHGSTVITDPSMKGAIENSINEWRATWAVVEPQLPEPEIGLTFEEAEKLEQEKIVQQEARNKRKGKRAATSKTNVKKKAAAKEPTEADVSVKPEPEDSSDDDERPSKKIKTEEN